MKGKGGTRAVLAALPLAANAIGCSGEDKEPRIELTGVEVDRQAIVSIHGGSHYHNIWGIDLDNDGNIDEALAAQTNFFFGLGKGLVKKLDDDPDINFAHYVAPGYSENTYVRTMGHTQGMSNTMRRDLSGAYMALNAVKRLD
jgi:hypothetical protein